MQRLGHEFQATRSLASTDEPKGMPNCNYRGFTEVTDRDKRVR
jgi:hypothetical protein